MSKIDIYSQYISRQQYLLENSLVGGQKLISEREVLINRLMAERFTSKQIEHILNEMPNWARSAFGDAFSTQEYKSPQKTTRSAARSAARPAAKSMSKSSGNVTSSVKPTSSVPSPSTAPVVGPKVGESNVTSSTLPAIKTPGTYFNPSMGEKKPETSVSSPARPPVSQSKIDAIRDIARKQENKPDTTTTPSAPKTQVQKEKAKSTPISKALQRQADDDAKMPTAI